MDIAKIRKKLKEKETNSQQSSANGKTSEEHKTNVLKPAKNKSEQITAEDDNAHVVNSGEGDKVKTEPVKGNKETAKVKTTEGKFEEEETDNVIEILIFDLLKEEFAFKVSQLEEIRRYQVITMVPKMPNYVLGVTSLRGKVIPVIDLKTRLSLKDIPTDIDRKVKMLLILTGNKAEVP